MQTTEDVYNQVCDALSILQANCISVFIADKQKAYELHIELAEIGFEILSFTEEGVIQGRILMRRTFEQSWNFARAILKRPFIESEEEAKVAFAVLMGASIFFNMDNREKAERLYIRVVEVCTKLFLLSDDEKEDTRQKADDTFDESWKQVQRGDYNLF